MKYLPILLLLTACSNRPVDADNICKAALEGYYDSEFKQSHQCVNDVWVASFRAAHDAAKPYRDLPRGR